MCLDSSDAMYSYSLSLIPFSPMVPHWAMCIFVWLGLKGRVSLGNRTPVLVSAVECVTTILSSLR